ncbi:trigger factor [Planifilum fulgidum]|jgi:trigger factor|uniref:Trigger factor n=1 Tax=Planifilum fulgidum TaxID=201973 RepID=A0A1I2MG42_9BACL|nr:trigger factor [Planifilum fulgidum]SFF90454.1 trigger factor [Planifilum fulgidum]
MKASWEKTENNQGVLTVEVDGETVEKALNQAFRKVVKRVTVPGFRKGKVPRAIFERRFGVEVLYEDALDILLPDAYASAVKETGIEPVDRPEIEIEQMEKGKPLIFKATVTVKPEVKLGEYKGLEVPKKDFEVKPEDVDAELEAMRKRQGQLEAVEDGTVEKGDRVIIDFEGTIDGKPFEGGKADGFSLEVGSGRMIPGFEDQLIGMKPGEEKTITVTFPEDYHVKELSGKEASFRIKLHEIKRLRLPELDDEFAQDVSEFDTLEELKKDIENKLKERAKREEEEYRRNQLVEMAAANAEIDLPPVMVEREIDHMLEHFEQHLRFQGMNLEMYKQFSGKDDKALREEFREEAEKKVRANLVLEAIAKEENLEVTDEEIDEELEKLAEQLNQPKDEVRRLLEERDGLEGIKNQLLTRKAVDLLVSNSKNAA